MMKTIVTIFPSSSAASTDGSAAPSASPSAPPTCHSQQQPRADELGSCT